MTVPSKDTAIQDREQVRAGLALLKTSRLVVLDAKLRQLSPVAEYEFEAGHATIDPVYGRFISWIIFSAGAELLAKGVCLVNGIRVGDTKNLPNSPPDPVTDAWMEALLHDLAPTTEVRCFGTLGKLTGKNGHLKDLCVAAGAGPDQERRLLAAYTYLQKTIRNRDVHGYLKNIRSSDFRLVENLFLFPLNLLISWLPSDFDWEVDPNASSSAN